MTKKQFIALADAIRDTKPEHNGEYDDGTTVGMIQERENQWQAMTLRLADFCQSTNPNFKRDRWLDYIAGKCGPNGGAVK